MGVRLRLRAADAAATRQCAVLPLSGCQRLIGTPADSPFDIMFNNDKKLHLLQHALNNHKQLKCKISHRKISSAASGISITVGTRHSDSFHRRSVQTRRSSSLVLFCTRLDWLYMSRSSQCSLLYDEPSVISLLIGCPSQTVPCSFGYMNAHLDFPPKQQTSSSLNR